MRTYWHCEKCDFVHYVDHDAHATINEAVHRIRTSHEKLKPKCQNTVDRIRVIAVVDFQPTPEGESVVQ